MRPRWQRRTKRDVYTVDVTAFLSLMVILVPFLLITAVFTQTSILELQPTVEDGAANATAQSLQLQVTVRDTVIEVNHRDLERTVTIDRTSDSSALATLTTLAVDLKARYPQNLEATLLLEPHIPYDLLIQVLDSLRIHLEQRGDIVHREPLFPLIALGTAPDARASKRRAP